MNRKWLFSAPFLALGAIAAAITLDVNNPVLNSHIEKLKGAGSLTVAFSVNRIGNDLEDHKLVISKPGLLRWESPSTVVIANGTSILSLNKKTNQYTEDAVTPEAMKKLLSSDVLWAWSAVTDGAFLKPITDAKAGASRKLKGIAVKELNVARGEKVTTFFIDDKLGFARGVSYDEIQGGQKVQTIVLASEIKVDPELQASDKMFAMPAAAQKIDKSALALTFKDVSPIFAAKCGCHTSRATGGVSLANYKATMNGGRNGSFINPGDPEGSLIIELIKGTKQPKMPPQGNLTAPQMETLTKWIKDGAKE